MRPLLGCPPSKGIEIQNRLSCSSTSNSSETNLPYMPLPHPVCPYRATPRPLQTVRWKSRRWPWWPGQPALRLALQHFLCGLTAPSPQQVWPPIKTLNQILNSKSYRSCAIDRGSTACHAHDELVSLNTFPMYGLEDVPIMLVQARGSTSIQLA